MKQLFPMNKHTLKKLESALLKRRQEVLQQVAHLEFEREELEQHSIEPIDMAQKENMALLTRKLDDRGKEEIGEIELALTKMSSDRYGVCELCGESIPIKRLKVLPATRLCRNCAQKYESAQTPRNHHRDEIIGDEQLDEFRHLNDENSSF